MNFTREQALEKLGISWRALQQLMAQGEIRSLTQPTAPGKRYEARFAEADVMQLRAKMRANGSPPIVSPRAFVKPVVGTPHATHAPESAPPPLVPEPVAVTITRAAGGVTLHFRVDVSVERVEQH